MMKVLRQGRARVSRREVKAHSISGKALMVEVGGSCTGLAVLSVDFRVAGTGSTTGSEDAEA